MIKFCNKCLLTIRYSFYFSSFLVFVFKLIYNFCFGKFWKTSNQRHCLLQFQLHQMMVQFSESWLHYKNKRILTESEENRSNLIKLIEMEVRKKWKNVKLYILTFLSFKI